MISRPLTPEHTNDELRHIPTASQPLQVAIEAGEVESSTPGFRSLALTRKPAAELRPSAQKFVQGMLEFSLSTISIATMALTGADCSARGTVSSVFLARNTMDSAKIDGRDVEDPHVNSRVAKHQQTEPVHELTEEKRPWASERNVGSAEGQWEGLSWPEDVSDDIGEPDSLGTVEVASKTEDGLGQAASRIHEPEDLLISLRGVVDLRKVSVLIAIRCPGSAARRAESAGAHHICDSL